MDIIYAHFAAGPGIAVKRNEYEFLSSVKAPAESGYSAAEIADIVVKNRFNAISNPLAAYGGEYTVDDILEARGVADPITELMFPKHADGATVVVLGTDEMAAEYARDIVDECRGLSAELMSVV